MNDAATGSRSRDLPRLLVILGSGETASSMTAVHQAVLGRLRSPGAETRPDRPLRACLIDTSYAFQTNAEQVTARLRRYFADQVGIEVAAVHLPAAEPDTPPDPLGVEQARLALRRADWIFAGPGSPSYAVRGLAGADVDGLLRDTLTVGGAVVFASAAACTLGALTVPVYEIYKVGAPPHWLDGLDVLVAAALRAAVIPHFDNTEGGTHDTRFCYLGARRLTALEAQLPADVGLLGVDEHTAAVLDLGADTLSVHGRGVVTARHAGAQATFGPGTVVPLARVREVLPPAATAADAQGRAAGSAHAPIAGGRFAELQRRFAQALAEADALDAARVALDVERLVAAEPDGPGDTPARYALRAMVVELAEVAQAGLHEHARLVRPFVQALLDLREAARTRGDYATADALRDRLAAGGVEVRDGPDGTTWDYHDPEGPGAAPPP